MSFSKYCGLWLILVVAFAYALREAPEIAKVADDVSNDGELVEYYQAPSREAALRPLPPRLRPRTLGSDSPTSNDSQESSPSASGFVPTAKTGQDLLRILVLQRK